MRNEKFGLTNLFCSLCNNKNLINMKKLLLLLSLFIGFSCYADEVKIRSSENDESTIWKPKRSPARLPQVTIEGNELTIYLLGEAEEVSIEVYDDCQNPVANNIYQGDEMIVTFNLPSLEPNRYYTLYLNIDETTYIGEFTK